MRIAVCQASATLGDKAKNIAAVRAAARTACVLERRFARAAGIVSDRLQSRPAREGSGGTSEWSLPHLDRGDRT